jgi:hypothetical protein
MGNKNTTSIAAETPQPATADTPVLAKCRCAEGQCLRNLKPHEYCQRNEYARLGAVRP